MTAAPGRLLLGLWLIFLVVTLSSLLLFFSIAPELVGAGHRAILATGAGIGLLAATAIGYLRQDLWVGQNGWRRAKLTFGLIFLGAGGGAADAELINLALPPAARTLTERPIVARSIARGRYGRRIFHILSLATGSAPAVTHIMLDPIQWRSAVPGRCVISRRMLGRLGGAWIANHRVADCSAARGLLGDRVIVRGNADGWRWHRSSWRRIGDRAAIDIALPPGTRCRTNRDALWLYNC